MSSKQIKASQMQDLINLCKGKSYFVKKSYVATYSFLFSNYEEIESFLNS